MTRDSGSGFVPALSYRWLTRFYDVLLQLLMRDAQFKQRLIRQASLADGQRILDLGCGTATLTMRIRRCFSTAEVIGLDRDPEVLGIARKNADRAGVRLTLVLGSATALPYLGGSFDRVVSSLVIHHLDREAKRRALRETYRVLRPGGQIHIADFGKPHNHRMRIVASAVRHWEHTDDNFDGRIPAILRDAGFAEVQELDRFSRPFGTVALFAGKKLS